jgi:outer membrane protein TolC
VICCANLPRDHGPYVQSADAMSADHRIERGQMSIRPHPRRQIMMATLIRLSKSAFAVWFLLTATLVDQDAMGQQNAPMHLTLDQAIDLAVKQNQSIHLRSLSVDQMRSKKDVARSNYFPQITASGNVLHVTELQGVEFPAGAFGNFPSIGPVPPKSLFVDQGSNTAYAGGVGLEQPLTQLFRIHEANIAAKQDVLVAKTQLDQTQDAIALQVRQLYYNILITQQKFKASQEQLSAAKVTDEESRNDVARGNALEISTIRSEAAILQAQQQSLTLRLQGEDLRRQLADLLGLPVSTQFELDEGTTAENIDIPSRVEAVHIALEHNQDLRAARQTLDKAKAGLAAAKDAYIPDVTALSRYSYQSGVPFLVHNFGTFGFLLSYDLFDGGRREAQVREARIELRSAEVNVDKLRSDIEVQVQAAYDRIEELKQMMSVAEQALKVGTEAARLADRQFEQNAALDSARSQAHADLSSAKASLLETDFSLSLAKADLKRTIGQMPR